MGNVISTNVASLNAQRNLFSTNNGLSTTFQRLSSGFRINSAKDDASGLFISNQLTSQIIGLNTAGRNASDGISIAQTAEGALQEVTNLLQRMREISLQAANGITTDGGPEKNALDAEYQQLSAEITRIATQTRFGSTLILDGSVTTINIQVGVNAGEQVSLTLSNIAGLTATAGAINTEAGATAALALIDADIISVDNARAGLGAVQNRLTSTISNLNSVVENASASRSRIRDTDFALETSNLSKFQVLQQAGLSVLSQANASSQNVLSLLQG
ncbi:MAG: flagellin FliC [Gammaproteobacteria bacterium]|nr:flagellin FliC [Gammaproteobacteria bacterium]